MKYIIGALGATWVNWFAFGLWHHFNNDNYEALVVVGFASLWGYFLFNIMS